MKKSVNFFNRNIPIAADLYLPENFNENRKYAVIITCHPASGCKEQTAGVYAEKLSKKGFVTLAIDASYQGASGGEPRFIEEPSIRVEDIRCAVDYLVTLPYVDENRIGVLGFCAGGGYAANAAMTERRIKAVGTVVAVNIGRLQRDEGQQSILSTLETVSKQRTAEARGEEPMIVSWLPENYKDSQNIDLREGYDYYRTSRGQHSNSPNKLYFTSLSSVIAFDAFHLADILLTQPLLIITCSTKGAFGANKDGHKLYQKAASAEKELIVMEEASHIDLYDKCEYVDKAVDKFTDFYQKFLV
ncbi:alpha/beta hydrolase [Apibacter raozihei]|uniref:alpha/beta hydrolase n=1 Tax=Apibacter raozihei TaxID=2500547 RepID=UPI000FE3946A|nr:alpha/beta hydrolase [Apibacter raozihei]